MKILFAVSSETFIRLRRDKIFLPALLVGIGLLGFSGIASYWGIEEFFKIMYDIGTFAYLFTGSMVAIFWGNKIVSDSKQEGSLEVQLASPIGRSTWLIGKYLGLAASLLLLALGFIAMWQLIYLAWGMGSVPFNALLIFACLTLVWLIMGALSVLLACTVSSAVALFCSIWIFICGLISGPIMQSLAPETPPMTRKVIEAFAGLWNLHFFNLASDNVFHKLFGKLEIADRVGHSLLLIGFFLSIACLLFRKRDIAG